MELNANSFLSLQKYIIPAAMNMTELFLKDTALKKKKIEATKLHSYYKFTY